MELSKFRALSFFSDRNKAGCRDTRTNLVKSPPAEQGARLCVLPFAKKVCLFAKNNCGKWWSLAKKTFSLHSLVVFQRGKGHSLHEEVILSNKENCDNNGPCCGESTCSCLSCDCRRPPLAAVAVLSLLQKQLRSSSTH